MTVGDLLTSQWNLPAWYLPGAVLGGVLYWAIWPPIRERLLSQRWREWNARVYSQSTGDHPGTRGASGDLIREGTIKKGGQNPRPSTPRPAPPEGQGGSSPVGASVIDRLLPYIAAAGLGIALLGMMVIKATHDLGLWN